MGRAQRSLGARGPQPRGALGGEPPETGFDPDLCLIEPRPPNADDLDGLSTWKEGHVVPRLAIEVVSSRPRKDYATAPEKCAAAGIEELWIFDPKLAGPKHGGGPHRLQIWRRDALEFNRIHAGEGPAFSPLLSAFLFAVNEGQRLRIADDPAGTTWWMTGEESALARVRELEDQLRRR